MTPKFLSPRNLASLRASVDSMRRSINAAMISSIQAPSLMDSIDFLPAKFPANNLRESREKEYVTPPNFFNRSSILESAHFQSIQEIVEEPSILLTEGADSARDLTDVEIFRIKVWNYVLSCNAEELLNILSEDVDKEWLQAEGFEYISPSEEKVALLAVAVSTGSLKSVQILVSVLIDLDIDRGYTHEGLEMGARFIR